MGFEVLLTCCLPILRYTWAPFVILLARFSSLKACLLRPCRCAKANRGSQKTKAQY